MQKTANQIKSSFETLASGHYQIHSFLYAQEFEQQAYENLIYPLMLVYPLGGSLSGTTYSRNYRVIIADRVLKSEGNELEVESDTQLIALDVLAYWMKLGQNERFTITSSNTITPFWEKWGDEVTGHFVDIGIEEFYDFNSCAIPLSGSIPTPVNPCKDARISVNSVVYGNAPSDSNFNVVVKDQDGDLVGSLIGDEWIVNTGGSCADATYTIEDSLGNILYTGTIVSGGSLTQAIGDSTANLRDTNGLLISTTSILAEGSDDIVAPDGQVTINGAAFDSVVSDGTLDIDVYPSSGTTEIGSKQGTHYRIDDSVAVIKDSANLTLKTENIKAEDTENITINDSLVNVRKSDNVLISAVSVKAENTENYLVADSLIENDASTPTYSQLVKATEGLILPTQEIQNNGVASGFIPSVGTINVTTNAAPTTFTITGRTIDIVVPSGSSSYDIDTTDRFGNVLPTIIVSADTTLNWNSYDYADIYLSRLLSPPTGAQETAVFTYFDDLITTGIFQRRLGIFPIIGGTSSDIIVNAAYPYNSDLLSTEGLILGSPTITSDGITINSGQCFLVNALRSQIALNSFNIFVYSRTNNLPTATAFDYTTLTTTPQNYLGIRDNNTNRSFGGINGAANTGGTNTDSRGGYHLNGITGTNACKTVKNGNTTSPLVQFTIGSSVNTSINCFGSQAGNSATSREYAGFAIGTSLTDTQMTDDYNIWQALQTALGRQV